MNFLNSMAETFPLMRGGGAFLAVIGLGIVVGAFGGTTWRFGWLIAGAAGGVLVMAIGGATKLIFAGLPQPSIWQWVVLAAAFLIEGYLVSLVVRRFPDLESRAFWMWMLFAVGAHFLVLGASHGPICALLGAACMLNAWWGLRATTIDFRVFWGGDGLLKIGAGVLMVLVSYAR